MTQEQWMTLWERVENHNRQITEKSTLENHLHLEVIEKPSWGIAVCKGTAGHLTIIMGDDEHNVGDIISHLPTGEKMGDAVGMKVINTTSNN